MSSRLGGYPVRILPRHFAGWRRRLHIYTPAFNRKDTSGSHDSAVKKTVDLKSASQQTERTADEPDPVVNRFLDAVWMERGLSPNTLAAYRADLTALSRWLAAARMCRSCSDRAQRPAGLHRLRASRPARGRAPPRASYRASAAFSATSCAKDVIREDPTAQIAMPKIGRSLPKSLTRRRSRVAAAAPGRERSARPPRPHHARSAVRHRPARLGAREPAQSARST